MPRGTERKEAPGMLLLVTLGLHAAPSIQRLFRHLGFCCMRTRSVSRSVQGVGAAAPQEVETARPEVFGATSRLALRAAGVTRHGAGRTRPDHHRPRCCRAEISYTYI
ncbi:hypothetical protein E2C01_064103 [Portunus trituberculatus]|uniref:Uncharacterized protein n=1 Tax=Portunus trituberculatus TaxID=210409 RepID=A0A5B7HAU1_PORTR|nr:hypothetical protein [Portunus trituberculatus]